jgi:hypothetical protein
VNSLQEVTKSGVGDFHEFVQVGTGASGCAMSGRRLKYSHAAPATVLFGIALRLHALPITRGPSSPAHDSARLGPDQPSCVVAYAKCICRADWRAVARASLPVPLPCVQRHHSGTPIAAHRLVVLQTLAIAAGSTPLPSDALVSVYKHPMRLQHAHARMHASAFFMQHTHMQQRWPAGHFRRTHAMQGLKKAASAPLLAQPSGSAPKHQQPPPVLCAPSLCFHLRRLATAGSREL